MVNKWKLAKTLALPIIGGSVAGIVATKNAQEKYASLKTPKFSPPSWVFPVAWTSLYTLMGVAKYNFDQKPKTKTLQKKADNIYSLQLGFNFFWSFLFFRWDLRGAALVDASLLWTSVAANTYYFYKKSKLSGSLMLPYMGWNTYAIALNYAIWDMNFSNKKSLNGC